MKTFFKFLQRNKLYTAIEVFGLSVALGFVVLLASYARTEYSVGRTRPAYDSISCDAQSLRPVVVTNSCDFQPSSRE